MGDRTSIEWTDATWNPVRGCSRVSEGCRHCYAEQVAARFSGPGMAYEGLAKRIGGEARWTGKVVMVPKHLGDPLRWTKPRRVFVNSMSDLFHEGLSFEEIAAVFGVMAAAPRHTFQVLTKRPLRALEFIEQAARYQPPHWVTPGHTQESAAQAMWDALSVQPATLPGLDADDEGVSLARALDRAWPLPNVWLGVSVENQETADERIPLLLQTPAAVRFVSYEPALGPVDFRQWLTPGGERFVFPDIARAATRYEEGNRFLDWIIVGGESGRGARPFDVQWARRTVEQCRTAGVSCFVKQMGAHVVADGISSPGQHWPEAGGMFDTGEGNWRKVLVDGKGGDWSEWPEDLRVRQFPEARA